MGGFATKLDRLAGDLQGKVLRDMRDAVAKGAVKDAAKALTADIGDQSMSHWPRRNPFTLSAETKNVSDGVVEVLPARRARGPWRVLESGRQAHTKGDRRASYRTSKKTGKPLKGRLVKRSGGATRGKGTWSEATAVMARETPKRTQVELHKALGRRFTGG